jgi:TrpR family trp operon transcriptional repressor
MNEKKYLSELIATLLAIKTPEEMRNFLEGIFTAKELIEVPTRLQIVKKLKEGVAQHQIAEELAVGVATVTRGSKELQKGKFTSV